MLTGPRPRAGCPLSAVLASVGSSTGPTVAPRGCCGVRSASGKPLACPTAGDSTGPARGGVGRNRPPAPVSAYAGGVAGNVGGPHGTTLDRVRTQRDPVYPPWRNERVTSCLQNVSTR
jgi:hypothetical protein